MMPPQPLPVLPPSMPNRLRPPACPSLFSPLHANNNHSHIRIVYANCLPVTLESFCFLDVS
ncbi:hypothetical protein CT19431_MP80400 [Cupriavidus taiwanensis]|nr:hypothetical protein CT19431_MP80400 [Cupriavidus taiwanensis]